MLIFNQWRFESCFNSYKASDSLRVKILFALTINSMKKKRKKKQISSALQVQVLDSYEVNLKKFKSLNNKLACLHKSRHSFCLYKKNTYTNIGYSFLASAKAYNWNHFNGKIFSECYHVTLFAGKITLFRDQEGDNDCLIRAKACNFSDFQ